MKTKILRCVNYLDLEEKINVFIEGKRVMDIKFCVEGNAYYAMIIYVSNNISNNISSENSSYETTTELL